MSRRLTIWGGIGGNNGVFPAEGNREVVCDFLDRCAEGRSEPVSFRVIRRAGRCAFVLTTAAEDTIRRRSWPWCPPSTPFTVGTPSRSWWRRPIERGIEVHPYNAVGYTGMTGIDYQSGTRLPEWRLTRFANDHPELWMRRRDGKTSLRRFGVGGPQLRDA